MTGVQTCALPISLLFLFLALRFGGTGCGFLFFQGFVVTEHVSGGGRRVAGWLYRFHLLQAYTSNDNLVYIYQQNVNQFDALLFGGSYTYNTLLERVGSIPKPCAFFNIADRDYFRVIAQLAIQEPGVDFSRVFFDQPDQPVDFESVLGPQGASIVEEIDPSVPYGDYWNQGLNRYRELWQSGQADWIVSRFGSMEEQLQKEGIRYKLLLPSKESMLDTFYGLLLRLQEKASRGGATGIGLLRPHSSSGRQLEDLAMAAEQASRQMGGVFLVYRHGPNVELTVSAPTLWEATRQYTSSRLLPFLKKRLDRKSVV